MKYSAITEDITVSVLPVYLDRKSSPIERRFVFAYHVRIENGGFDEVQLLRRHWRIVDASGHAEHVEGEGVVGRQPILAPGEVHEYESFCVLKTFEGFMEGTYTMERENGSRFRVTVPRFDLAAGLN
ncbi:MAG: Co2+/Mg2+ efflux protein ApaG [Bacteroidota bacterium]